LLVRTKTYRNFRVFFPTRPGIDVDDYDNTSLLNNGLGFDSATTGESESSLRVVGAGWAVARCETKSVGCEPWEAAQTHHDNGAWESGTRRGLSLPVIGIEY